MKNKFLVLPLLITCVFFFLFCFILFDLSFRAKLLAFIIFTSISVLSGVFALKYRENLTLLYLCLACIGGILALGSIMVNVDIPALSEYDHIGHHKIEGYFTSVHYSTDYHSAHFARVTKVDGKEARFNTYILFDEKLPENNYKCFTLEVELGCVEDYAELNLSKRSFDARGIRLGAIAKDTLHFTGEAPKGITPFFARLNELICQRILYLLPEDSAGLVCALLFGNRSHLPITVERDFMTLGITHMLVVSGMNIALIAGEFDILFGSLIKRKRLRTLLCCTLCILYMALCSFTLSVVRAALMQIIYRLAPVSAREYDSHTALFSALGIILIFNPSAIFDIGLLLSFFATLGIISFSGFAHDGALLRFKVLRAPLSSLIASLSACIFVMPISFAVFECTSLASFLFTLLFSPILDCLLYVTPALLIASFIPFIDSILAFVCDLICRGVYLLCSFAVHFKDLYVSFDAKPTELFSALIILSVAFAFLYKTKKKHLKLIPPFASYILICAALLLSSTSVGAYYTTDNESEAIILSSREGTTVLDVSEGTATFAAKCRSALIKSPLKSTNIDSYFITHTHLEHIRGAYTLATRGYLSSVYMPTPISDDELTVYSELSRLGQRYGFEVFVYKSGDSVMPSKDTVINTFSPIRTNTDDFHSLLYYDVVLAGRHTVYLGQAASDTDFRSYTLFENADAVVIGCHYPRSKLAFSYRFFNPDTLLAVCESTGDRIVANVPKTYCEKDGILCLWSGGKE